MAGRFWCQKGVFELSQDVTLDSKVKFEGTITQPDDERIILQKGYNFKSYLDAFGDEERAFKKAYQALLNFADHEWFCRKFFLTIECGRCADAIMLRAPQTAGMQ